MTPFLFVYFISFCIAILICENLKSKIQKHRQVRNYPNIEQSINSLKIAAVIPIINTFYVGLIALLYVKNGVKF